MSFLASGNCGLKNVNVKLGDEWTLLTDQLECTISSDGLTFDKPNNEISLKEEKEMNKKIGRAHV